MRSVRCRLLQVCNRASGWHRLQNNISGFFTSEMLRNSTQNYDSLNECRRHYLSCNFCLSPLSLRNDGSGVLFSPGGSSAHVSSRFVAWWIGLSNPRSNLPQYLNVQHFVAHVVKIPERLEVLTTRDHTTATTKKNTLRSFRPVRSYRQGTKRCNWLHLDLESGWVLNPFDCLPRPVLRLIPRNVFGASLHERGADKISEEICNNEVSGGMHTNKASIRHSNRHNDELGIQRFQASSKFLTKTYSPVNVHAVFSIIFVNSWPHRIGAVAKTSPDIGFHLILFQPDISSATFYEKVVTPLDK